MMLFFSLGYLLIWLLLLGYTTFIHGEQRKLEKELTLLQELASTKQE